MNPKFAEKLATEKEKHDFGEIRHTLREPSTRSINTYTPPAASRLLHVLNLVVAMPERRHAILVDNDAVAAVIAHVLCSTRKIIYAKMGDVDSGWRASSNIVKMLPQDALTEFNSDESNFDTLIMLRNNAASGYRLRDRHVVLSSTMDLTDREARQYIHRSRGGIDGAEEDVRAMIFLNRADTEKFMGMAANIGEKSFGFD